MTTKIAPHQKQKENLKRVLGFFVAKGFLIAPAIDPLPSEKLDLQEVIDMGLEFEPRIIEVLPAALLYFPASFVNRKAMPEKLKIVLANIRNGADEGPALAGIPFNAMKRWANKELSDRRVVPASKRKISKNFRLSPQVVERLAALAQAEGKTETEIIEQKILMALSAKAPVS